MRTFYEINLTLYKLRDWTIKDVENPSTGEREPQLCIPLFENGIVTTKKGRPLLSCKLCGRFLVPTLKKETIKKMIDRGLIEPDCKRPVGTLGAIRKVTL